MPSIDAFIFAAGLGTRMGPLSSILPKPAWTLKGKPLLQWAADSLSEAGCYKVACNAHHHIAAIKSIAGDLEVFEEPVILGTGEPIRRIASRISDEGLLVWNADVMANPPFAQLKNECIKRDVGVGWLLVPHPGGQWTELYTDSGGRILPRGTTGPKGPFLFTGASWWGAEAAEQIPENCFDVRDFLAQYPRHFGIVVEPFCWLEIGTPDQLIHAAAKLAPEDEGRIPGCYLHPTATEIINTNRFIRCIFGPGARLSPDTKDNIAEYKDELWFAEDGVQMRVKL